MKILVVYALMVAPHDLLKMFTRFHNLLLQLFNNRGPDIFLARKSTNKDGMHFPG